MEKSIELTQLLNLIEKPLKDVKISCDGYTEKFCRTTSQYRPFPKEIKGPDGNKTTLYYESKYIRIHKLNDITFPIYTKVIINYKEITTDIYRIEIQNPEIKELKESKLEFINKIKEVDQNRELFKQLIEDKRASYRKEMEILGVRLGAGSYYIDTWPENCQYKNEWYTITIINDYSRAGVFITMHKETELYKEIYKGIKGERIIDKIKAGRKDKL
jgi:hypothetical protein